MGKRAVPNEPVYYVRSTPGGMLKRVRRVTRPSWNMATPMVTVQDVDTDEVDRIPARDLIRG